MSQGLKLYRINLLHRPLGIRYGYYLLRIIHITLEPQRARLAVFESD